MRILIIIAFLALTAAKCAHGPNPCIGKPANELPCWCPATTSPECAPWITDAKQKPRGTCYRMTIGCEEIQWDDKPDARGVYHGKCIKSPAPPAEIPCADVPHSDSGAR